MPRVAPAVYNDFTEQVVSLSPGDRLVACSDGITDALNRNFETFGEHRLIEALDATCTSRIEAALAATAQRVEHWCADGPAKDDLSILAIERLASE